jgi:hypothetical protein
MFLGLPDPDSLVRDIDPKPDPPIIKTSKKTLIPTVLILLKDFLFLKNVVNVPLISTKQKNFIKN